MDVTVCTLTRDRTPHLLNQIAGLARSEVPPSAHVVAVMGGEDPRPHVRSTPWETRFVDVVGTDGELPLAAARNSSVRAAETSGVVLLDVDCIPARTLVGSYAAALEEFDGLLMGAVRYLRPGAADGGITDEALWARSQSHPVRPDPPRDGLEATDRYELFWSLSFAVRRETMLERIGGFDEGYDGYGAEDTDLAFRAREAGVPLAWIGAATAYHQHHDTYDPPLQHVRCVVANARRFRARWGRWPMEGWLRRFEEMGIVRWQPDDDELELLREPRGDELAAAHRRTALPTEASRP